MPGPMRIGGSRRPTQTTSNTTTATRTGPLRKCGTRPCATPSTKRAAASSCRCANGEWRALPPGRRRWATPGGPPATSPTTGTPSCRSWTNRWGSSSTPGHWNGGMKPSEYEAHFVLWAALKSPLLIGCDLSKMSDDTLRILTNEEVIAVSQDRLGKQAKRLRQESGPRDYWVGSSRPIRTGMRGGWLSRLTGRSGGGLHVFAESGYRTADEPVRHDQGYCRA
jgi:hypothetical protein